VAGGGVCREKRGASASAQAPVEGGRTPREVGSGICGMGWFGALTGKKYIIKEKVSQFALLEKGSLKTRGEGGSRKRKGSKPV